MRRLVFHDDYRLTLVLEPDGRLRTVLESSGVDGVDLFSMGKRSIVETARHSDDGERRSAEWAKRLRALNTDRRPIHYFASVPGSGPGQPDTVECVATPVPAADGSLECILLQAEDKSTMRRVEEQLRQSEERFRVMAESLPQMVWIADHTGAVVYFSPRWCAFTGRSEGELLGDGFLDLVHPDDRPSIRAERDHDGTQINVFRLLRYDQEYRWVEASFRALPDASGNLSRWVGGTTDITDRRRLEAKAREQQEQLRVALAVTGMGRFALYFRDDVLTGDARLSAILGVEVPFGSASGGLDELFGMVHHDDVEHVRAAVETAAGGGSDYDVEYRMLRPVENPEGATELRWVAARGRVEFDDDGPFRMVGVVEDITERKAEEEARLRWQKRETIGTLAGGIAHDFNNVISAILSNAALAETEMKFGVSPSTSISEIARGADRAADIVRRLLAFSREDEPQRTVFDPGDVVSEACALMTSTLPSNVTLRCTVAPSLPTVYGSSTELHQVVVNLLANAGHAIDGRGQISVDVDTVDGETSVAAPGSGHVRIRVQDDGSGIPESVLAKIFDPFFTTKPAGKGTGLGLAAARTIVRGHGGTIHAANTVDGACVTVMLPSSESVRPHRAQHVEAPTFLAPPVAAPSAAPPEQVRAALGRVFFVDDEEALVRLAERALPIRGFDVRTFTDPSRALEALKAEPHHVDVLITDLSMPGITGLELIQRVRAVRPDLPVVLSSGFLTAANREEADRHGVDVVVPKPCSIDDLATALVGLLEGRSRADQPHTA